MDTLYLAAVVAIFIATILLAETVISTWSAKKGPEARRVARRLKSMTGGAERNALSIRKKQAAAGGWRAAFLGWSVARHLERRLAQAAIQLDALQFAMLLLAWFIGGVALGLFLPIAEWMATFTGAGAAALPWFYVMNRSRARLRRIEEQLPEALDLISRALRAGHAFPSSLQMVANEMADPIAAEFRVTSDEVNYGVPMSEAMANLAGRLPGTDVGYFVVAVTLQRETGGDLTEVLANISKIVRERLKLLGQVRALSAEGRLSAWILGLMPFCLTALTYAINPKFISILWEGPTGRSMLAIMLFIMAIGVVWMQKIIRIRV